MTENKPNANKGGGAGPGLAVFGCLATGVLACIGGMIGILNREIAGAGICFIGAAIAFGIVAYVSFSD